MRWSWWLAACGTIVAASMFLILGLDRQQRGKDPAELALRIRMSANGVMSAAVRRDLHDGEWIDCSAAFLYARTDGTIAEAGLSWPQDVGIVDRFLERVGLRGTSGRVPYLRGYVAEGVPQTLGDGVILELRFAAREVGSSLRCVAGYRH